MARVSIEKQALTDLRFSILGSHFQSENQPTAAELDMAFGLWLAIRVWDYCSDRCLLVIDRRELETLRGGLSEAMIDAELAEIIPKSRGKRLRIRGGAGRLDWNERARRYGALGAEYGIKGAEYGKLGGRPRLLKTPHDGVSKTGGAGDTKTPLLAHALTHAQTLNTNTTTSSNQASPDLDAVAPPIPRAKPKPRNGKEIDPKLVQWFAMFWDEYPRREGKQSAWKAFVRLNPTVEIVHAIGNDLDRRINDGLWQPDDEERKQFIPLPATYINGKRWEDEHETERQAKQPVLDGEAV